MADRIYKVDLRAGYRIEVAPNVLPRDTYGARLYGPRKLPSGRVKWEQAGPLMVADTPEAAASDLLTAINQGLVEGVEVAG